MGMARICEVVLVNGRLAKMNRSKRIQQYCTTIDQMMYSMLKMYSINFGMPGRPSIRAHIASSRSMVPKKEQTRE